jgi:hypothetical protein
LLSGEDATSERVRFDDNVSFIDDVSDTVADLGGAGIGEQPPITRLLKARLVVAHFGLI